MKIDTSAFLLREGHQADLEKRPTAIEPVFDSQKQYQKLLKASGAGCGREGRRLGSV